MNRLTLNNSFGYLVLSSLLVFSEVLLADSPNDFCRSLDLHQANTLLRPLTQGQRNTLDLSKIDWLNPLPDRQINDLLVIDADNDGQDDLIVSVIEGSGHYGYMRVYGISQSANIADQLIDKGSVELGVYKEPEFIRIGETNYLLSLTESQDAQLSQIEKKANGYQLKTLCRNQAELKLKTQCRHPACQKLTQLVETPDSNQIFVDFSWMLPSNPPMGLSVYFSPQWKQGEVDNAGININQAKQTRRLQAIFDEQSASLSQQLQRTVKLPQQGAFFLFQAHGNRTYWAWDLGDPPLGNAIHLLYTNSHKSDYIGTVQLERHESLKPCQANCITPLPAMSLTY